MLGILSDLTTLYQTLKHLKDLKQVVDGNKERCTLLIERCSLFETKISSLMESKTRFTGNREGILRLHTTVKRCIDFIEKFGKKGWKRFCLNIANANSIESEFNSLNTALLEASSDLQFFILVENSTREEDRRAQDRDIMDIMNAIMEESQKAGKSTADILSVSYQQLEQLKSQQSQMAQLMSIIPSVQKFLDRSSDIISLSEASSSSTAAKSSSRSARRSSASDSLEVVLRFSELDMSLLDAKKELIGRGQYGLVYAGRYNHRPVALKEFQALGQQSDEVLRKIKREAAIMTLLRHKNIISFEGFSLHSGLIAMELAHCSLFNILHNKEKYAAAAAFDAAAVSDTLSNLTLCADIANGVRYLHFHHIQHRDLKTANILIFRDSERPNSMTAKISDFGIASIVGSTSTGTTAGASAGGGTLAYMAPELLGIADDDDDFEGGNGDSGRTEMESSTSFSYSSDIYAAGIVFNEIWTCTVPWSNLTHYSLVAPRVAKGKRPVLYVPQRDAVNEQVLMNLIGSASAGCLSQYPFHRPTAALVYQELSRLLENQQHRDEEDSSLSSRPLQPPPQVSFEKAAGRVPLSPSSSVSELHDISNNKWADAIPRPPPIVTKNAYYNNFEYNKWAPPPPPIVTKNVYNNNNNNNMESRAVEEMRLDGMKIGPGPAASPSPRTHHGTMECKCSLNMGCKPFPLDTSYFHSDDCKWLCCGQEWHEASCTCTATQNLGIQNQGRISSPLGTGQVHSDGCGNLHRRKDASPTNAAPSQNSGRENNFFQWSEDILPNSSAQSSSHEKAAPIRGGHPGFMICNCLQKMGRLRFPLDKSYMHLDECKWTCCNQDWSEDVCPVARCHKGLMTCNCTHKLGRVPFPLMAGQVHRNKSCKWLCCNLNWNEDICSKSDAVT